MENSSEKTKALYQKYKKECDELFGEHFLEIHDNCQRRYYVYAWYTLVKEVATMLKADLMSGYCPSYLFFSH